MDKLEVGVCNVKVFKGWREAGMKAQGMKQHLSLGSSKQGRILGEFIQVASKECRYCSTTFGFCMFV